MADLRFEERTYRVVDYKEIDRFIQEHYGKEYSVQDTLESSNDAWHAVGVTARELDDYEHKEIADWTAGKAPVERGWGSAPYVGTLLEDLCSKSLVEAGNYLIHVFW